MRNIKLTVATYFIVCISMLISVLCFVVVGVPLVKQRGLPLDRALFYVFLVVTHFILFIFSFCVWNGVRNQRPSMMVPWVRAASVISFGILLLSIIQIIITINSGDYENTPVVACYMVYACFLFVGACIVQTLKNAMARNLDQGDEVSAEAMLSGVADDVITRSVGNSIFSLITHNSHGNLPTNVP